MTPTDIPPGIVALPPDVRDEVLASREEARSRPYSEPSKEAMTKLSEALEWERLTLDLDEAQEAAAAWKARANELRQQRDKEATKKRRVWDEGEAARKALRDLVVLAENAIVGNLSDEDDAVLERARAAFGGVGTQGDTK